jgi:hypothetical protein
MTRAGFFKVQEYYFSQHGRHRWPMLKEGRNGMRVTGLTPGVNWKARDQGVVIHEANYISTDEDAKAGRTWGCWGFAKGKARQFTDKLQGGGMIYNYAPMCGRDMRKVKKQVPGWEDFCE